MKLSGSIRSLAAASIASLVITPTSSADLLGYWPVTEDSGTLTTNAVAGGFDGNLNGNVGFFNDPERGDVLQFFGTGGYVDAGFLPQQTLATDFTWSFWAKNETDITVGTQGNTLIVGNRYSQTGSVDFSPREFTKFTPTKFEYHRNGATEAGEYPDLVLTSPWTHVSAVKQGDRIFTYHDGILRDMRRITAGQNNSMPLYFGGNGALESWTGKLDDVAVWNEALPTRSIGQLATGASTPQNVTKTANLQTVFSDDFSAGLNNFTLTDRGLEGNEAAGYDPQTTIGDQLVLGGTAAVQHWRGSSVESMRFSSLVETMITVDRVSLSGSGTAFRSSLWVFGDDTHYLHFSQNVGESGWTWNSNDVGGVGTLNPTGSGNNIVDLDSLDASLGTHTMGIHLVPTGDPGAVNMFMYLDGQLVAGRGFSAFPDEFSVILTGQARQIGDNVSAVFDDLLVTQVPEPSSVGLMLLGAMVVGLRRRSR